MTALPTNRGNNFGTQIGSALQQFANQLEEKKKLDHYNKVFAANPQLAKQYFGGLEEQQIMGIRGRNEQRELEKQDALRQFAQRIGGVSPTGINPDGQSNLEGALSKYAQITGDPTTLLNYKMKQEQAQYPASMGATGALAQQLIDEPNNGIDTFYDALVVIKGGAGASGRLDAEITKGREANFEKTSGTNMSDLLYKSQIAADTATAENAALFGQKGQQGLIRQQRAVEDAEIQNTFLNNQVNEILPKINGMTTGWKGAISKASSGEAFDVYAQIQTILANSALDTLVQLKSEGGTLGALSEKELELLMAKKANLDLSQNPAQLRDNLQKFIEQNNKSLQKLRRRYEEDYNRFQGDQDEFLPAPNTSPSADNAVQTTTAPKTIKWGDL